MTDRCYVCGVAKPRKEHSWHCWCFHPEDSAKYRGICDACYAEKGNEVFKYVSDDHRVTRNHKYGPEMDEYVRKYKLPKGRTYEISYQGDDKVYTDSETGERIVVPPVPKCTCCDHSIQVSH